MKLMFMIVRDLDSDGVTGALIENGYRVTRVASTGGFLHRGNVTLMAGVEDDKVQPVIDLMRATCGPADDSQHRATVFVVDMPFSEQI